MTCLRQPRRQQTWIPPPSRIRKWAIAAEQSSQVLVPVSARDLPDLSAVVEASTNDGSLHLHLPITAEGKVGKSLRGTTGNGEGRVTLKTHDGSITIK